MSTAIKVTTSCAQEAFSDKCRQYLFRAPIGTYHWTTYPELTSPYVIVIQKKKKKRKAKG